jgi:S1-C subfamily serine protease
MLRRLAIGGVVSISWSWALLAHAQLPATVPTTQKVVTTAPSPPPDASAKAGAGAAKAEGVAPNSVEKARQGVVVLERQGKPLALGVVLDGDGRVLTALSPLSHGNFISARYHDGTIAQLKLVHSDRAWDLALLLPVVTPTQTPRKAGVRAAKTQSFVGLQSFTLTLPNTISAAPAALKLGPSLQGGDGATLNGAYELDRKPTWVGGPVLNAEGEAVALIARACPAASNAACVPAPYGVPIPALKQFLQRVPAEATWLGIDAATDESRGVRALRVVAVTPDSPAAAAGLRPGKDAGAADLIIAVDGVPVGTPAELNEAVRARTTGDSIDLLLFGMGRYRHVSIKPRPAPQLVKQPYVAPKPTKPRTPNPYR